MKKRIILTTLVASLVAGLVQAEDWCQWLDARAQVVAYINVKALREVPLMAELVNGQDAISRFTSQIREWTAIDLDSITDAWVGLHGQDEALVILRGNYNLSVIRGAVGTIDAFRVTTPAGIEFAIAMPDDKKPGKVNMLAFLTDSIAVFGSPALVEEYLHHRDTETRHPRHAVLASLEKPDHLFECVAFTIPNGKGDVPEVLIRNLAMARITGDAGETASVTLALEPKNEAMVDPLCKLGESLLDLYDLLPPEQVKLGPVKRALIDNADIAATPRAAVFTTTLPLNLIRGPLAAKLGRGGQP